MALPEHKPYKNIGSENIPYILGCGTAERAVSGKVADAFVNGFHMNFDDVNLS